MQEASPLISIITPVYNAVSHVARCVESVQAQSYKNYEHIFLDSCSEDGTTQLVEEYVVSDDRIRLIVRKDKGVYDAMNGGVQEAKGKWVYFLGADDYLFEKDVLLKITEAMSNTEYSIVYGNVWFDKLNRYYDGRFTAAKILERNICHQSVFYSIQLFKSFGEYDLKYTIEADYHFNLRCWLFGVCKKYIPIIVAFHRSGGISSNSRDEIFVGDFPKSIINAILKSKRGFFAKVYLLATAFRKIIIRYSFKELISRLNFKEAMILKILALTLMILGLPFYLIFHILLVRGLSNRMK